MDLFQRIFENFTLEIHNLEIIYVYGVIIKFILYIYIFIIN